MLLLLLLAPFALVSGLSYSRVCNLYKDTAVTLQSYNASTFDFTIDEKTVAANTCDDFTFDATEIFPGKYRVVSTVGDTTFTGTPQNILGAPDCDFEGIVWITPDSDGSPTIAAVGNDATCTGTDVFFLNYCVGTTLNAYLGSTLVSSNIAYDGGKVLGNQDSASTSVKGAGAIRMTDTQVTVELCYDSDELTTTGKAMYYICSGDNDAGYKGYKVISTSGTIGEIVQTVQSGTTPTCESGGGAASLFIWASLAITLAHFF